MRIRQVGPRLWIIAPAGAPTPLDAAPGLDTAVLEVVGGHLSWSLLTGHRIPAATVYDLAAAQDWLWALYGVAVAVAVDDHTGPVDLPARPERPELATATRRLAYAHWAARWWPASTVDGIAALDPDLLGREITALTEECDLVVDGADAWLPDERTAPVPASARADDYALAAGGTPGERLGALVIGRGSGGWDWRRCPPGLLDASEHAVSWELLRVAGSTRIRVEVVAAPGVAAEVPTYLRPRALVRTAAGDSDIELELLGDSWIGASALASENVAVVEVYVPGVGPAEPVPDDPDRRRRVRELAADRLRLAASADEDTDLAPLLAETTAAALDTDF